jgi:hypothetical protein
MSNILRGAHNGSLKPMFYTSGLQPGARGHFLQLMQNWKTLHNRGQI